MGNEQLTVSVGERSFPVFLQEGFFDCRSGPTSLHKHRYTEVHLTCGGECEYLVGERRITLRPEQALILPPDVFHECLSATAGSLHTAFQTDFPVGEVLRKNLPCGIVNHLCELIASGASPGKLSATLGFICAEIFDLSAPMIPLRDPAFIIHERLANQYATDLSLSDLAEELGLSKKQTERMIVRHTGNTFRTELTRRRMEAARHLIETEDVSLAEASERVGYKSYSGFWKAFHNEKK